MRRSAAGAGGHRASACDPQRQTGSLLREHNTACPMGGPLDKLSPVPVGHSSPGLGHLKEETEYSAGLPKCCVCLVGKPLHANESDIP